MLCAGRGSRLGKKTSSLPKCMVEIKGKPIIDWTKDFRKNFKKTIIVCGYRKNIIIKKFKSDKKISFSVNKFYNSTNMVYSLFSIKNSQIKNNDVVICYSDIIFNPKIFNYFKRNNYTFLPLKDNWLKLWKKRMPINKIIKDAENIITKNSEIIHIGGQIKKQMPKLQFMGLMKIKNHDYFKLKKYFKKQDINIDFTNFINLAVQNKIIKAKYVKVKTEWYEIDNLNDLKLTERINFKW